MKALDISNEILQLQWNLSNFELWRIGLCENLLSKNVKHLLGARENFLSLSVDRLQLDTEGQKLVVKEFLYFCSEGDRIPIANRSILEDYTVQKKSDNIFSQWVRVGSIGQLIVELADVHAEGELSKLGLHEVPRDVSEAAKGDVYLLQLDKLIEISLEVKEFLEASK